MSGSNNNQKAIDKLRIAAAVMTDKLPRLQNYQAEIDCMLENACNPESRQEILDILYKSKHYELIKNLNQLKFLLDNFE